MPKCEKIEKPKTLKIEESVLNQLKYMKIEFGFTNYSDLIDFLIVEKDRKDNEKK